MNVARAERLALCDTFLAVGPDAPTLAGEWTTRDLAAHLVVRERRPDAALGIIAPPFERYGDRVRRGAAEGPWEALVERVRSGPPVWSPMHLDRVDTLANTIEFFVHHEDVRRAQPDWSARALAPELVDELWRAIGRMARLLVRKAPCGIVLAPPSRDERRIRSGEPAATLHGEVGELVLFVYGRQDAAQVDIDAPPELADALRAARFGL